MSDDQAERSRTRIDNYAAQRVKVRSDQQSVALKRAWEMAREALQMRSQMGVKNLSYSTDLLPGVGQCQIAAWPDRVEVTLSGIEWVPGSGDVHDSPRTDPMRYVIDEAWLLGVTVPTAT